MNNFTIELWYNFSRPPRKISVDSFLFLSNIKNFFYFKHRRENKSLWGVIRLIVDVPGIQLLLQEPPDATYRAFVYSWLWHLNICGERGFVAFSCSIVVEVDVVFLCINLEWWLFHIFRLSWSSTACASGLGFPTLRIRRCGGALGLAPAAW